METHEYKFKQLAVLWDTHRRIKVAAAQAGLPMHEVVRIAMEAYLDNLR